MMQRALSFGVLLSLLAVGCGSSEDEKNATQNDGGLGDSSTSEVGGLDGGPAPPGFELVADLNTRKAAALTPYDTRFVEAGGKVFFVADNGQHGPEPMASDGTVAGTKLLKDLVAGTDDGDAGAFIAKGDKVYFVGKRDTSTMALFRSDGTPEGTVPIVNTQGGASTQTFRVGEKLCFLDSSLRCSDDAVTTLTKVLDSTSSSSSGSSASLGSIAVFTNSTSLWSTDGVTATKLVDVAIEPGGVVVGGKFVFWARASGQMRPFMSDGTMAGSRVLADIIASGSAPPVVGLGTKALTVNAGSAVVLDPTAITATPLTDLTVQSAISIGSKALLWAERRSVSPLIGSDLWVTDGTDAGTSLVSELTPGSSGSYITWLGVIGGDAFFLQNESGATTRYLYKSNGTAAGTVKLGEWKVDAGGDRPGWTTALGKLFFRCADATSWKTLCTIDPSGAVTVVPINRATASSAPSAIVPWGDKFFVTANDGDEPTGTLLSSMFVSDGTPGGTKKVGGKWGGRIATLAEKTFFTRIAPDQTDKWELAWFGADPATATSVATFNYTSNLDYAAQFPITSFGGKVWFAANSTSGTITVHSSDGTAAGTKNLSYTPSANYAQYGGASWPIVSDKLYVPTTTGVMIADATGTLTSLGAAPGKVTAIDAAEGRIWFSINGTLWVTDGTAAGTTQVQTIGTSSNPIWRIVAISKSLAYLFTGSGGSPLLYASDGTPTGTKSITSVPGWQRFKNGIAFLGSSGVSLVSSITTTPVVIGPRGNRLLVAGDRLFFASTDELHGEELWVSDGGKANTKLAGDLRIGKASSSPTPLAVSSGYLYLSADNGAIGAELWRYRVN